MTITSVSRTQRRTKKPSLKGARPDRRAALGGDVLLGKRGLDHFVGGSTHRGSQKVGLLASELVDCVRQQAVLDLIDADVAKSS